MEEEIGILVEDLVEEIVEKEEDKELAEYIESLDLVQRQFDATNEDFIRLSLLRLEIQRFVNHSRGIFTIGPVCSLEEAQLMMNEINYLVSKLYYNILFE